MVQDTYKRVRFYGETTLGGNNSRVSVADHASLNPVDAITVIARIYMNPADKIMQGNNKGIVSKSNGGGGDGMCWMEYNDSGGAYNRCFRFVVTGTDCYSLDTVKEAGWYHVVGTFDRTLGSNQIRIYQNSVRVAVATRAVAMVANALNVVIGGIATGSWMMKGYISEVQIYNRALSEDEVNYNYLHPNNPKRRGLVLNLTQDSIYGTQWQDLSGNANHGTYLGGAVPVTANILAGR